MTQTNALYLPGADIEPVCPENAAHIVSGHIKKFLGV
jgi:hypothetical protein